MEVIASLMDTNEGFLGYRILSVEEVNWYFIMWKCPYEAKQALNNLNDNLRTNNRLIHKEGHYPRFLNMADYRQWAILRFPLIHKAVQDNSNINKNICNRLDTKLNSKPSLSLFSSIYALDKRHTTKHKNRLSQFTTTNQHQQRRKLYPRINSKKKKDTKNQPQVLRSQFSLEVAQAQSLHT